MRGVVCEERKKLAPADFESSEKTRTSGYGSMVEFLLAMEGIGVRFPLAAPNKKVSACLVLFYFGELAESNGLK